jgi:hypothetical protein
MKKRMSRCYGFCAPAAFISGAAFRYHRIKPGLGGGEKSILARGVPAICKLGQKVGGKAASKRVCSAVSRPRPVTATIVADQFRGDLATAAEVRELAGAKRLAVKASASVDTRAEPSSQSMFVRERQILQGHFLWSAGGRRDPRRQRVFFLRSGQ